MNRAVAVVFLLSACAGAPTPVEPMPSPGTAAPAAPAAADLTTFSGVLTYVEIDDGRKSPEAYRGESLILTLDTGEKRVLRPTEAHDEAAIRAFDGQRVEVSAVWDEGVLPDPRSQHLIQMDGTPIRQGTGWRVWALSPAAP